MTPTKEMVEAGARALWLDSQVPNSTGAWEEASNLERNLCRKASRAALTAALAEMWRPIESAPKDEPCLIAWQHGGVWRIRHAYWDEKFEYNYDEESDTDGYIGAWTDNSVASWAYQERNSFEPTHWVALPNPPKVTP